MYVLYTSLGAPAHATKSLATDRELKARGADLPRRHRMLAAIVVETAAGLAAQPAGFDILHQQRTGAVFGIRETLVEHLHDAEAGIQADEVGQLQRAHGVI